MLTSTDAAWRRRLMIATLVLVVLIGAADFCTGFLLSLLVFYLLPVCLAVAAAGPRFGVLIAFACVGTWLGGDAAAGAHYSTPLVPIWNALIALFTYLVVVCLLTDLLRMHREMEERVVQRTQALTQEIAERERLEKAVLEISERDQRTFGRDLHDGLGQHLTGTVRLAEALGARLQEKGDSEAAEMRKVVASVRQALEQTRHLARGLLLSEIERDEFTASLSQFAASLSSRFNVDCRFDSDTGITLPDRSAAIHLYRITQEAAHNAVRHGGATRVSISLRADGGAAVLRIQDNGSGLPPPRARGRGLGIQIMAHRASIIGARFSIEAVREGGTLIECILPAPNDGR